MSAWNYVLTLATVLAISCGQILLKIGAVSTTTVSGNVGPLERFLNIHLFLAVALYGGATALWIWVLRTVPLGIAYPFVGLAFVFVPLLTWLVLDDPLTTRQVLGGAVIAIGVWIGHRA
ncbi:MAG: EamA family transporter [Burkholderiales bacterium]|nr:EamA family transporter [Burkholderiales bacterium]